MISNETIQNFLACRYKSYLQVNKISGNKTEYELLERDFLTSYKLQFYQSLRLKYSKSHQFLKPAIIPPTHITKESYIIQPSISSENYTIEFDALEILPQQKKVDTVVYLPIDIISTEKVSKIDKMTLTIKSFIFSQLLASVIVSGRIVYGRDLKVTSIDLTKYFTEARKLLGELIEIITSDKPPRFFQNSHCRICEHQDICKTTLIENDDLSLLRGLGQKEIMKYNNKGIFTVLQLSYTFKPRKKRKPPKQSRRFEWALKALALREKQTYVQELPDIAENNIEIYVDFEGLPDENFIYLIGLLIKDDQGLRQISLWADSIEEETTIFVRLFEILAQFKNINIYHYGSYETRSLNRFNKKTKGLYQNEINHILKNTINILSFFIADVYPPTNTNELKDIARYIGFRWSEQNASGLQSIVWRRKWELSRDLKLKSTLITYNIEDCYALIMVKEWLLQVVEKIDDETDKSFIKVNNMRSESYFKWGDTQGDCMRTAYLSEDRSYAVEPF